MNSYREKILSPLQPEFGGGKLFYTLVHNKPWSTYNSYLGGYASRISLNRNASFNKYNLEDSLYHEIEHHIQNMCREYCYATRGILEASIVVLNSPTSVIDEGTAASVTELLEMKPVNKQNRLAQIFSELKNIVRVNAALMLNQDGANRKDVLFYLREKGLICKPEEIIKFIEPLTSDGKQNFWAPYVFSYYFGKEKFVLPAMKKAKIEGKIKEFFKTLYFDPYARSTHTFAGAISAWR